MPTIELSADEYKEDENQQTQKSLWEYGALVEVVIRPDYRDENIKDSLPFISICAKIDTGAVSSCIDIVNVAKALDLAPYREKPMNSATGKGVPTPQFMVSIEIEEIELEIGGIEASGFNFYGESFRALIGRDVLQHCNFAYNGPNGTFSLSYEKDK